MENINEEIKDLEEEIKECDNTIQNVQQTLLIVEDPNFKTSICSDLQRFKNYRQGLYDKLKELKSAVSDKGQPDK